MERGLGGHASWSCVSLQDCESKALPPCCEVGSGTMGTMGENRESDDTDTRTRVIFHAGKKETHRPEKNYKHLQRKLKAEFKVVEHKDSVVSDKSYNIKDVDVAVFAGSREKFKGPELRVLEKFIDDGGSVVVLLGEGGEQKYNTNLNALLEKYGMFVNSDHVVRMVYLKPYSHPKEVCIQQGVVNRGLTNAARDLRGGSRASLDLGASLTLTMEQQGLSVMYPYGATIAVKRPAVPLVSTAQEAYPLNSPIIAVYDGNTARDENGKAMMTQDEHGRAVNKKGRLLVVGSAKVFDDDWLPKEENQKLLEILMRWMKPDMSIALNQVFVTIGRQHLPASGCG